MRFTAKAKSDIGIIKNNNQDSILVKHATFKKHEIMMAVVCDGMGGLSKGEVASASVIEAFSNWFNDELPYEMNIIDMEVIARQLVLLIKEMNERIINYSNHHQYEGVGTTCSCILMIDNQYLIVHIGDSRIYFLSDKIKQLSEDHTFVAREVSKGLMTKEEASKDKRRNLLLQCVGASKIVEPQVGYGVVKQGIYLLCSDGFIHEISEQEIYYYLNYTALVDEEVMTSNMDLLIEMNKQRGESDNISLVIIKVDGGD